MAIRTDLAVEVLENSGQTTQNAVQTEKNLEGFRLTQVEIHREDARLGKPPGSYYTLSVDALLRRDAAGARYGMITHLNTNRMGVQALRMHEKP